MSRQTQIVATIGPASAELQQLKDLITAGVNIFRLNTKHNTPEWHVERIHVMRQAATEMNVETKIMLDLQGPELRLQTANPEVQISPGESVTLQFQDDTNPIQLAALPPTVRGHVQPGQIILIADGKVELEVREANDQFVMALVKFGTKLQDHKSVNIPNVTLEMPALTERDIQFVQAAADKVDFLAQSFVRTAQDITDLRNILPAGSTAKFIAKLENRSGLDHRAEIIAACDGLMVARGDLGVEIPFEEVPFWQKTLIRECNAAGKFVITATQMMLTMVENPYPSRAEVGDVANAVLDGTNATMLSEETAMGAHPARVVAMMAKILQYYEEHRI
jgi:pyruvate kinase